ncbi:hypothetical protein GP486_004128 [Trichoglossum hirsutum]|uniref:Uncharacterized protein n=1 Tax=Trichoglossum hirsutum TaxID=265104 RepID=A0A9P8LBT0_9PEZI|nr:hypothetical protein GP486_004128 [Trichoglossum hirsutum]
MDDGIVEKSPIARIYPNVVPLCNVEADLRNIPETEFQINRLGDVDQEFYTADFAVEFSVDNARVWFTTKLNGKECGSVETRF